MEIQIKEDKRPLSREKKKKPYYNMLKINNKEKYLEQDTTREK